MGKAKYPFKRAQVAEVVKRMVKQDDAFRITREIILFYKVYEQTPRWDFWSVYHPGFMLNCMAYFLSPEGKEHLKVAIAVFDLVIEVAPEPVMETEKVGLDAELARQPSLSSLLR